MGQKCNPLGFRLGRNYKYRSCWFAKKSELGKEVVEDYFIRNHINENFYDAVIVDIFIDKILEKIVIRIFCLKPNLVIGKDGETVSSLCSFFEKKTGRSVFIYADEAEDKKISARVIAYYIEERVKNRQPIKRVIGWAAHELMQTGLVEGVRIYLKGRLGGAEIARVELTRQGSVPLNSLKNFIDYSFTSIKTEYGVLGLRVIVNRGKVFFENKVACPSFRVFDRDKRGIDAKKNKMKR